MEFVRTATDLAANIDTFTAYVGSDSGAEREFAVDLVARGHCFVVTRDKEGGFFSPGCFVGYRNNTRHDHANAGDEGDGDTSAALQTILGAAPEPDAAREAEYARFCGRLGIPVREMPADAPRTFWDLR